MGYQHLIACFTLVRRAYGSGLFLQAPSIVCIPDKIQAI